MKHNEQTIEYIKSKQFSANVIGNAFDLSATYQYDDEEDEEMEL